MSGAEFLRAATARMVMIKQLGEGALAQLDAPALFQRPGTGQNSIAILVQHLRGNMLSRWTDFLTTDGEKPWRERDTEFEPVLSTRAEIESAWAQGWACCLAALESLKPSDMLREITIRGEAMTVIDAVIRQIGHYGYHVGQIVQLARQLKGSEFSSLSIPRGKSREYRPHP